MLKMIKIAKAYIKNRNKISSVRFVIYTSMQFTDLSESEFFNKNTSWLETRHFNNLLTI